jgi:hypothetical protein
MNYENTAYGFNAQEVGTVIPGAVANTGVVGSSYDANTYTYAATNTSGLQISNTAPNNTIVFHGPGGKEVGRFDFSKGTMEFEGNANEAGKVFTEWCRNQWNDLRDKDKREVLQQVMDDLLEESSGELYSEEEKVAILTCMHRVQARKKEYDGSQSIAGQYATNLAKSMSATKEALAGSLLSALAPEGSTP